MSVRAMPVVDVQNVCAVPAGLSCAARRSRIEAKRRALREKASTAGLRRCAATRRRDRRRAMIASRIAVLPNRSSNVRARDPERIAVRLTQRPENRRRHAARTRTASRSVTSTRTPGIRTSANFPSPGSCGVNESTTKRTPGKRRAFNSSATRAGIQPRRAEPLKCVARSAPHRDVRALERHERRDRAARSSSVGRFGDGRTHGNPVSSNHIARRQPATGTTCSGALMPSTLL